eukprot:Unigene12409_Nuclearia_a/m.37699 Unigene12409_Nuclearia_a/g.37699  ORF Unigene12409_Nuclearia_a/g.37699 Unigene12409_Nuclearia_a/m.37699 type:complete len:374 (+) Unigene12409_Nuclearia_a:1098-2219(+)
MLARTSTRSTVSIARWGRGPVAGAGTATGKPSSRGGSTATAAVTTRCTVTCDDGDQASATCDVETASGSVRSDARGRMLNDTLSMPTRRSLSPSTMSTISRLRPASTTRFAGSAGDASDESNCPPGSAESGGENRCWLSSGVSSGDARNGISTSRSTMSDARPAASAPEGVANTSATAPMRAAASSLRSDGSGVLRGGGADAVPVVAVFRPRRSSAVTWSGVTSLASPSSVNVTCASVLLSSDASRTVSAPSVSSTAALTLSTAASSASRCPCRRECSATYGPRSRAMACSNELTVSARTCTHRPVRSSAPGSCGTATSTSARALSSVATNDSVAPPSAGCSVVTMFVSTTLSDADACTPARHPATAGGRYTG